jgi:ketosteroid isomerase-like protein
MSQENVELVRASYDALNRGDIGAVAATVADDAEITTILSAVEGGRYTGPEGIRSWWEDDVLPMFTSIRFELRDLIDRDDLVIGTVAIHARGRGSAVDVEQVFTHVHRFRNGKVIQFKSYTARGEALEAVGLRE